MKNKKLKPKIDAPKVIRRYMMGIGASTFKWITAYSDYSITMGSAQSLSISTFQEIVP